MRATWLFSSDVFPMSSNKTRIQSISCCFLCIYSGNVWETFKDTAQKLGNVYRMHVLGTVYIVISDPAIAKQVLERSEC